MAVIKKTKDDKYGQGERVSLCTVAWECKLKYSHYEQCKEVPQKKIELPMIFTVLFCIYTYEEMKSLSPKDNCIFTFILTLFAAIAKTWKQPINNK